jgi:surfeit locus 1 family protein
VFVTVSLGFWQLSRAADKVALQGTIDARQLLPALDGSALSGEGAAAPSLYRSVVLRGTWLGGHTVFLDNRQMNGKPGFFVVTPLQLERSGWVVLVQRGWSARSFTDRTAVPDLPTPTGVVELQGRIVPPPSKLYEFEASQAGLIRQNLDLQQFSREIGRPLAAVSVLQTGPPGDGLLRDWPRVNLGVDKHYGYAFQWFALGGLITLLYGWFQVVKRFVAAR